MSDDGYKYSAKPTRNPFRYLLAVWRLVTQETTDEVIQEAAIVEIGFARSKLGRRLARWGKVIDHLNETPVTAAAVAKRDRASKIDLSQLDIMPEGTLGKVFATSCRTRGINPNLVNIPPTTEEDWLLNHLFQTHDIWHVVTGWKFNEEGELGLGGFYCGQLKTPAFFTFMLGLLLLKAVWRREDTGVLIEAFNNGYRLGKATKPMFGMDWDGKWLTPIDDIREDIGIATSAQLETPAAQAA
jgi:ubiquinone biosynthesis protein Coq4